jgi:hypothetical protein
MSTFANTPLDFVDLYTKRAKWALHFSRQALENDDLQVALLDLAHCFGDIQDAYAWLDTHEESTNNTD